MFFYLTFYRICTVKPTCSVALIKCQPAYSDIFFCPDPLTTESIYPIVCHPSYSAHFGCLDGVTLSGFHCNTNLGLEKVSKRYHLINLAGTSFLLHHLLYNFVKRTFRNLDNRFL